MAAREFKNWIAKKYGRNWHIIVDGAHEPVVAWVGGMDSPHSKAAAHLLGAAPKLLDRLERLLGLIEAGSLTVEHSDRRATEQDIKEAHSVVALARKGLR